MEREEILKEINQIFGELKPEIQIINLLLPRAEKLSREVLMKDLNEDIETCMTLRSYGEVIIRSLGRIKTLMKDLKVIPKDSLELDHMRIIYLNSHKAEKALNAERIIKFFEDSREITKFVLHEEVIPFLRSTLKGD